MSPDHTGEVLACQTQPEPSDTTDRSVPGQPQETLEVEDRTSQVDDTTYPTGLKLWLTLVSILIVAVAKGLDLTIVAVAVPALTNEFKTINDIGWYSSAYGLSLSAFTLFFGKVYQVFPLKPVFILSVAIFTLGSLLCTIAPTSATFITGRALAGLGSSGIGNGAITIFSLLFPLQKRPMWFGICGAIQSIAMVSAPLIGGALIDSFSWRACFGINLPVGAIAIVLIVFGFHDPTTASIQSQRTLWHKLKSLDLVSTVVILPCITCLLLALQWGGSRYGWNNGIIISLLVTFAVLLTAFCFVQYKLGDKATVPPAILQNRNIIAGAWFQACCDGTLAVTEYYVSIYLQGVRGFTAVKSGALGLPMIIGLMISSLVAGVGTSIVGYYTPFMLASTIIAPVPAGIMTTLNLDENLVKILCCLGALGVAVGLGISAPFSACQTVLAPKDIPIGNAIITFGGGIGSSLLISASAGLFQNRLSEELRIHSPSTNVTQLEHVGLSDIRSAVGPDRLRDVLLGYDISVTQTLYIPVALTILSLAGSAATEWRSVKKKTS